MQPDSSNAPIQAKQQDWLTVQQAAERVQCSDKVIYRAAKSGKLRCARAFGSLRFKPEWVDTWLEQSAEPVEVQR